MVRGTRRTGACLVAALVIIAAVAACSGSGSAPTADPTKDKLAQIQARGTLVGYAELDYPPQSIRNEGVPRATETKCLPNQITAQEVTGFDIETTKLVAKKLGVEACFVQPTFTEITAGNWTDRLDIAYASGAINATRMEHLWMTQPYYYIPQVFVVAEDSPYQKPSDLDGKTIGTCTSCTVESYLQGTLEIPGVDLVQKVKDPELAGYETEAPGIDALGNGELDAFLTSEPVAKEAIAAGKALRILDETAFSMYPSGFVDKGSGLAVKPFVDRVNEILRAAHADGTMKALSEEWFKTDYTTQAGAFDLSVLDQEVK
ncbi:MAG TPA: transporter substrate-binding domain-containing protein [Candidatus Limnocylindrales bacterium]|nr:transporter substrate-binding domain-containing protein [Candidatus Limnocylindrales bacterium]